MQKQLYHDISWSEFLLSILKNLLRVYFNINKFHIKYITDRNKKNRNKKNVILNVWVSIKC